MVTEDGLMNAERFFKLVTDWRGTTLTLGVLGLVALAGFLPSLTKDTTADAFIAEDNPALIYRAEINWTCFAKVEITY